MNKLTLGEKFLEFVNKNKLICYCRTNERYYYLPYKSDKKNIKVYIYVKIVEDINTIKIGFRVSLRKSNSEIDEVRTTLLDLNAKLTTGALALEKDSNILEYTINYTIEDNEEIEVERYNKIISFCMNLFFDLYDKKLIERENSMDE